MPSKSSGYRAGIPQSTQPYTKWDADKDEVEVDYKQMGNGEAGLRPHNLWFSGRKGIVLKVLLIIVTFSLGLIIGYVLRRSVHERIASPEVCPPTAGATQGYSQELSNKFTRIIDPEVIKQHLRRYSSRPHLAGTSRNQWLRDDLQKDLGSYNVPTRTASYNVLLSYHDWGNPNTVYVLSENGSVAYQTHYMGPDVGQPNPSSYPTISEPYNAFSPNGTAEGELVYANFGEEGDFALLKRSNISCAGRIVIMRYGQIYRGTKVANAEKCGAIGALLYSDPAQVSDVHARDTYPATWWLPGWAVQRGTILQDMAGDPLTPGIPSKKGMFHLNPEKAALPRIPVQPIGYDDAHEIMMHMKGPTDTSFFGSMHENVTYHFGPGYKAPREKWKVRLEVFNEMEHRDITNVFGVIEGAEEPDRYIILGCHYDAWTYGAIDPNSGTAVLMEIARAFGNLTQEGWRPRRTLMFAHWDGEEQGLMGSYEWVEDHSKELAERTVVYINLDSAVKGNATLKVTSSPLLRNLLINITQLIPPAMEEDAEALYDMWARLSPDGRNSSQPKLDLMGSGSDHAPFLFTLGVPAMWTQYVYDPRKTSVPQYPAYHTAIDNFEHMSKFVDPTFRAHATIARVVGEMALRLATQPKLPLDVRELSATVEEAFNDLQTLWNTDTRPNLTTMKSQLIFSISNFSLAASNFHWNFSRLSITEVLAVRRHNDRLQRVSQCFIHPDGLPGRPYIKNLMFAPSALDSYSDFAFTGIRDAFSAYQNLAESDPSWGEAWQKVEQQLSLAILAVECATHQLNERCFT